MKVKSIQITELIWLSHQIVVMEYLLFWSNWTRVELSSEMDWGTPFFKLNSFTIRLEVMLMSVVLRTDKDHLLWILINSLRTISNNVRDNSYTSWTWIVFIIWSLLKMIHLNFKLWRISSGVCIERGNEIHLETYESQCASWIAIIFTSTNNLEPHVLLSNN